MKCVRVIVIGLITVSAANSPAAPPSTEQRPVTDTYHGDFNNFAPRFGFAFKASEKLALRGGYGIYFDRLSNQLGLLEALSLPGYDVAGPGSAKPPR